MVKEILDKEKELEEFEEWLISMDFVLDEFEEKVPVDLDFSQTSLLDIEKWLLRNYPTVESLKNDSWTLNALTIYVGETFRKNLGGKWSIELDDPKVLFYGLPVLRFPIKGTAPDSPMATVLASIDRQKGDYMYSIVQNLKRIKG